ncbi:uncharacterized protein [Nicotiana sylvestris]|uniref:Uncharacterized protein LOC104213469 isoform X1 n=1 Tax=Nicotiana sylvestris TaxID=4096 RepID=A0A1U7VHE9_NICSY|nr:PREDICTED: uncharacterized protein LOC104213469 isoform X1 [Nicotiana sylvestris]XP_009761276.1 PREDICTED: uncharacterized protein LOC104213469 isoform X1 [Nicotiana sylvestris]XP_009761277.1 PREDICTED: uncharacterized protein LOC104213469 isoform X1 [Nicotiana sylvestris]
MQMVICSHGVVACNLSEQNAVSEPQISGNRTQDLWHFEKCELGIEDNKGTCILAGQPGWRVISHATGACSHDHLKWAVMMSASFWVIHFTALRKSDPYLGGPTRYGIHLRTGVLQPWRLQPCEGLAYVSEKVNLRLPSICLCSKNEDFYGTRERLRFSKGGYSLSPKFYLANEYFFTFVTKRQIYIPFISKMPIMGMTRLNYRNIKQ